MLYHPDTVQTLTATPLGSVRLAASPLGLSGLWFEDQRHAPSAFWQGPTAWPLAPQHALLREAAQQLAQYFDGRRTAFALPLDLSGGTPFQQAVWRALLALRAGSTTSYGALSRVIDRPRIQAFNRYLLNSAEMSGLRGTNLGNFRLSRLIHIELK